MERPEPEETDCFMVAGAAEEQQEGARYTAAVAALGQLQEPPCTEGVALLVRILVLFQVEVGARQGTAVQVRCAQLYFKDLEPKFINARAL